MQHRLGGLVPFLDGLGRVALDLYRSGGILAALPDQAFPIADARFTRHNDRIHYHARGAVYFSITRHGELKLSGQEEGVTLAATLAPYVTLGELRSMQGSRTEEAPTEGFPPPRFLLDAETPNLFIASSASGTGAGARTVFVPVEQYIIERARLFVDAFKSLTEQPATRLLQPGT
jgi:hypothetical protein